MRPTSCRQRFAVVRLEVSTEHSNHALGALTFQLATEFFAFKAVEIRPIAKAVVDVQDEILAELGQRVVVNKVHCHRMAV